MPPPCHRTPPLTSVLAKKNVDKFDKKLLSYKEIIQKLGVYVNAILITDHCLKE
jgi:hypothetical protein